MGKGEEYVAALRKAVEQSQFKPGSVLRAKNGRLIVLQTVWSLNPVRWLVTMLSNETEPRTNFEAKLSDGSVAETECTGEIEEDKLSGFDFVRQLSDEDRRLVSNLYYDHMRHNMSDFTRAHLNQIGSPFGHAASESVLKAVDDEQETFKQLIKEA